MSLPTREPVSRGSVSMLSELAALVGSVKVALIEEFMQTPLKLI